MNIKNVEQEYKLTFGQFLTVVSTYLFYNADLFILLGAVYVGLAILLNSLGVLSLVVALLSMTLFTLLANIIFLPFFLKVSDKQKLMIHNMAWYKENEKVVLLLVFCVVVGLLNFQMVDLQFFTKFLLLWLMTTFWFFSPHLVKGFSSLILSYLFLERNQLPNVSYKQGFVNQFLEKNIGFIKKMQIINGVSLPTSILFYSTKDYQLFVAVFGLFHIIFMFLSFFILLRLAFVDEDNKEKEKGLEEKLA